MTLEDYIKRFRHLHVSRSKGIAPHKPVLLIAVFDEIDVGRITENKIPITPELVATFKENWSVLVDSIIFEPRFALPFFHLKTDKFWHLVTFPGCELAVTSSNSIRSFSALKAAVDYAHLDEELFLYVSEPRNRSLLRSILLKAYFPDTGIRYIRAKADQGKYFYKIEESLLNASPSEYRIEIAKADEEEIFIRGGVFKKLIPRIYNYSCCISGFCINSSTGVQMIDACHIIPFSESHDDTISNGISLCPNLHRAFDRGLISVDDNYCVLISHTFVEKESQYSMRQFVGKKIALPQDKDHLPSRTGLAVHRMRWNFT